MASGTKTKAAQPATAAPTGTGGAGRAGLFPSYKADQGRYARMFAYWSVSILIIYGGTAFAPWLRTRDWGWLAVDSTYARNWFDLNLLGRPDGRIPILGFYTSYANFFVLGLVLLFLWWWHRFLSRPKYADLLIDTETELKKVTWPNWPETWNSTMVVIGTVVFLLLFLAVVDTALGKVFQFLLF